MICYIISKSKPDGGILSGFCRKGEMAAGAETVCAVFVTIA